MYIVMDYSEFESELNRMDTGLTAETARQSKFIAALEKRNYISPKWLIFHAIQFVMSIMQLI